VKTDTISYDEWRKALAVWQVNPAGFTAKELCAASGLGGNSNWAPPAETRSDWLL